MTQVMEPQSPSQSTAPEAAPAGAAVRWIRGAGIVMLVVSAFGGIFPYFANGLGLPIDGYPDGEMTLWRTVLHLVPGTLGVAAAIYLLVWAHRMARSRATGPAAVAPGGERAANLVLRGAVATGIWFWVGAYLWGLVEPGNAIGTGGLAGMMRPMGSMAHMGLLGRLAMPVDPGPDVPQHLGTVSCVFTMGVCHWAVGVLVIAAALVALGVGLRRGPLGRYVASGSSPIPSWMR